jgi:hypothetical protein
VRWQDDAGRKVVRSFSAKEIPPALFSYQRLAVTIGPSVGIQDAAKSSGGEGEALHHAAVDAARDLPHHWIGYEGVNVLIILSSHAEFLSKLSRAQTDAILQWTKLGGRVIFSVGTEGKKVLAEGQPFADLAPGQFQDVVQLRRTSGLEHFVNARSRLDVTERGTTQPLTATSLTNVRGRVDVYEGAGLAGEVPLVIRSWHGLGYVTFVAFDLDRPPLSNWSERSKVIAKLLQETARRVDEDSAGEKQNRVVHLGYDDMVGQLRSGLEQFAGVSLISFSTVAAMIVAYLLLLGPADFFATRFLRRPEFTWLTFPLLVVVFGGIAWAVSQNSKSADVKLNQVDLVDVDVESQTLRGTSWAHVYSPRAESFAFSIKSHSAAGQQKSNSQLDGSLVTWQGLPGRGFGGLNGTTTSGFLAEPYTIALDAGAENHATHSTLENVVLPTSATKALIGRWWGRWETKNASSLTASALRDDMLRGKLTNPLPFELRDCAVLIGTSIYPLDETLSPGETINMDLHGGKRRDLERRLTRRRVTHETKEEISPWDAGNLDVIRTMEVLMFHEASGGQPYTKLSNRYQPYVDLTEQLRLGRAVLVGRAEKPAATWLRGEQPLQNEPDKSWAYYRIVFPVTREK